MIMQSNSKNFGFQSWQHTVYRVVLASGNFGGFALKKALEILALFKLANFQTKAQKL